MLYAHVTGETIDQVGALPRLWWDGDRCTRGGRLYECLVAHGAEYAGTWGPPQATVWKDLGPA